MCAAFTCFLTAFIHLSSCYRIKARSTRVSWRWLFSFPAFRSLGFPSALFEGCVGLQAWWCFSGWLSLSLSHCLFLFLCLYTYTRVFVRVHVYVRVAYAYIFMISRHMTPPNISYEERVWKRKRTLIDAITKEVSASNDHNIGNSDFPPITISQILPITPNPL